MIINVKQLTFVRFILRTVFVMFVLGECVVKSISFVRARC